MAEITLTYTLLLQPSPEQASLLTRTCEAYLHACDLVSRTARKHRTLKQKELNQLTYRENRSRYGLGAQMAQSAIIRVISNYRTIRENQGSPWNTRHAPRYTSAGYDLVWNRDYSLLKDGRLSLNTLQGRIKLPVDWTHIPENRRKGVYGTARLIPPQRQMAPVPAHHAHHPRPADTQEHHGRRPGHAIPRRKL
ncbi:hypothetical protein [Bifidobacterium callitrichidarum]|uniref:hypothetical protein n=1 Tax=Bifidobacterium callitrichidarum TaxID=2052941 RepID=UPI0019D4C1DD|nr:hypothetical protein [Bifidobacterium callitrichidarum]